MNEQQFLIQFDHDSKYLGNNNIGLLLVKADTFENACTKVPTYIVKLKNNATNYEWYESYSNARNFVNLTI